ncbi:ATP-binding protein [Chondromyces crocatus]|uniref:D-tyrosyl-tRNA deacylase n=1 Tax=Chondromyces crocatus TaxID=52 RepID=A0A0K1EJJ0_CHOCO|nr:ATP-binding protein [Chondromyces crocatus]AKT40753.1 D-tyrosyl-tRNA deacylase [Chondromyces crocatus]
MSTHKPQFFDLNIGEILEAWSPRHAVRELIANALDEQALTETRDIVIAETAEGWIIRDQGRGLRHEHLLQNENEEKLASSSKVIGKFGMGLKDALATFHRRGISIEIRSKHGDITLAERPKHDFAELRTLHGVIHPPSNPARVGTEVVLRGLDVAEMAAAKSFFLRFSEEEVLGTTRYGDILRRVHGRPGRVYVKGLLAAEEENFACSYNITSLTAAMNKALNRERTHVGRAAYTERVQNMLLACHSPAVFEILATEIANLDRGTARDEVKWGGVAVHACKILNQAQKVVFVSSRELQEAPSMVENARNDGHRIISLPETIRAKLSGLSDHTGAPVRGLDQFAREWCDSFSFDFIEPESLTPAEQAIFERRDDIAGLVGGWPPIVETVLISSTMRPNDAGNDDALGVWERATRRIIIKRDQLESLHEFAGTLLHEITHARSGHGDVSRGFELALTDALGQIAADALSAAPRSSSPRPDRRSPLRTSSRRAAPASSPPASAPRSGKAKTKAKARPSNTPPRKAASKAAPRATSKSMAVKSTRKSSKAMPTRTTRKSSKPASRRPTRTKSKKSTGRR